MAVLVQAVHAVCIPAEDVGQHTGVMMDVDQHRLPLETRKENTLL